MKIRLSRRRSLKLEIDGDGFLNIEDGAFRFDKETLSSVVDELFDLEMFDLWLNDGKITAEVVGVSDSGDQDGFYRRKDYDIGACVDRLIDNMSDPGIEINHTDLVLAKKLFEEQLEKINRYLEEHQ